MTEPISFIASLPPIGSAINLDGAGDGARIKLDVPRSDTDAVLVLQRWYSGQAFRVTIEPLPEKQAGNRQDGETDQHQLPTRRQRQSRWQTTES